MASGIYIGQEVVKQWGESRGGAVVCGGVRGGGWDESLGQESKLHCRRQVPGLPAQSPMRYNSGKKKKIDVSILVKAFKN